MYKLIVIAVLIFGGGVSVAVAAEMMSRYQNVAILRIFWRIVTFGILSGVLTLLASWATEGSTLGGEAVPILSSGPTSLGRALGIEMIVDYLGSFGFVLGIWLIWTQGRNIRREKGSLGPWLTRLKLTSILIISTLLTFPMSFDVLRRKSTFRSALTDTPSQLMECLVLSFVFCLFALCGTAILDRFRPDKESNFPSTRS